MWILALFGVFIVLLTIMVVVGYWYVAKKYYWLQGDPSERRKEGEKKRGA
jgi:hypothetical protein